MHVPMVDRHVADAAMRCKMMNVRQITAETCKAGRHTKVTSTILDFLFESKSALAAARPVKLPPITSTDFGMVTSELIDLMAVRSQLSKLGSQLVHSYCGLSSARKSDSIHIADCLTK